MRRIRHSAFLFHILAVLATAARAQAPTLFWPANELMVRQAVRSDLHDLGRALQRQGEEQESECGMRNAE